MATTASDIIRRALRLLGVLDAQTSIEAVDSADALDTLNAMLAEWHEAGMGLPDYSFSSITDTLATDVADREAIAYSLALRLAPEYGINISPALAAAGQVTLFRLRSRYLSVAHPVPATYY